MIVPLLIYAALACIPADVQADNGRAGILLSISASTEASSVGRLKTTTSRCDWLRRDPHDLASWVNKIE